MYAKFPMDVGAGPLFISLKSLTYAVHNIEYSVVSSHCERVEYFK